MTTSGYSAGSGNTRRWPRLRPFDSGRGAGGAISAPPWAPVTGSVKPAAIPAERSLATLADGLGESDQVVLVRVRRQRPGMADQLPTAGGGDPARVAHAQIP